MVIIDHKTGEVLACVGGLGEKTDARGFNRATQSTRQTGSSIKPLAVLAPGIDKKTFTASTIYPDVETTFADGYAPKNYSGYLGEATVRRVLESSQNIPFVEMMEEIKPKNSIKYLEKMGITTLTEKDESLALALGGLDKGISPLEMAGAYATIANDGVYIEPTFYSSITNSSGKVILKTNPEKKRVFSEQVAYILKELLIAPVKGQYGTARYCSITGIDVAAKTGTTDDNFDRWLCGFTPYYTAVTWFGYDQNETIFFNRQNPAGLIWSNVMKTIHNGLDDAQFEKPSWIETKTICADTGCVANTGCTNTYTEYFLFGTAPKECAKHKGSKIKDSGNSTNNNYEAPINPNENIYEETDANYSMFENTSSSNQTNTTSTNSSSSQNTSRTNTTNTSRDNTSSSSNTSGNRTNSTNTTRPSTNSSNTSNSATNTDGGTNTSNSTVGNSSSSETNVTE